MQKDETSKCWICETMIYCLIFWNKSVGWDAQGQIDPAIEEKMV